VFRARQGLAAEIDYRIDLVIAEMIDKPVNPMKHTFSGAEQ
jgi:hypothetical protein